jgi:hypothetical protein
MGSHHKKKKKTPSVNVVIADIKRDADQEASKAALQPSYEGNTYIVQSRTMIDFVNVTESTDPSQTGGGGPPDTIPPATVTGLIATAASSSQINLSWTANTEPDLNHYDIYRSTTNGFTVTLGVTVPVGSSFTNSYPDTGLSASTTYYYRVGAVDNSSNLGPVSSQASATTLAAGALIPSLELHLDSSFTDTSPNAFTPAGANHNGFILPGAFGTAGWKCNTPVAPPYDFLVPFAPAPAPSPLQMDTSIGFSISLWINPVDLSVLSSRRGIIDSRLDANNVWSITIDAGIAYFNVQKAGVDYKTQVSGFTTGSWQHLAATFNGATNTPIIYRNAVAGVASVATTQYKTSDPSWYYMTIGYTIGAGTGNSEYVGYYDEIRYYKSVVLTPTQITNLKNTNST